MSRIGRQPITLPAKVDVKVAENNTLTVKGPKGQLTRTLHPAMTLKNENGVVTIERPDDERIVVHHENAHRPLSCGPGSVRSFVFRLGLCKRDPYQRSPPGLALDFQVCAVPVDHAIDRKSVV